MSDDQSKKRSMNDISHLFLSNVRDLHGKGGPRPKRRPPGGPRADDVDGELTSDEIAEAVGGRYDPAHDAGIPGAIPTDADAAMTAGGSADAGETAPVTAVLASHLNGRQLERVRDYAKHLAASVGRVGLIELDLNDFRLTCFEPDVEPGADVGGRPTEITGAVDPREIAAAVEELNVDVDRWVLMVPSLRTPEATALVADAEHWALLCTPDHDGVVSAYRTLKGVAEARVFDGGDRAATRLTVAVLDAAGDAEAARVQQKLASVGRQFLNWDADAEPPVRYAAGVAEHSLMHCRVGGGRGQGVVGPHWAVVAELLGRPRRGAAAAAQTATKHAPTTGQNTNDGVDMNSQIVDEHRELPAPLRRASDTVTQPGPSAADLSGAHLRISGEAEAVAASPDPEPSRMRIDPAPAAAPPFAAAPAFAPLPSFAAASAFAAMPTPAAAVDEVLDLPGDVGDAKGILSAIFRRPEWGLAECSIEPPACPAAARLAVTRDRGLVLVAVAARGLADLRAIGHAYRWLAENQGLIAMALPQFAIDLARAPALHLLVDQADITGDVLRPMLQSDNVRVRTYRTLRWAGRTGLLLDAA